MKKLHSITYYMHLLADGCDACAAYNEIGGCGTWRFTCHVDIEKAELEDFMEEINFNFEQIIGLLEYWECQESQEYWNKVIAPRLEEEEQWLKEIAEEMDYDYWLECSQNAVFYDEQPWY